MTFNKLCMSHETTNDIAKVIKCQSGWLELLSINAKQDRISLGGFINPAYPYLITSVKYSEIVNKYMKLIYQAKTTCNIVYTACVVCLLSGSFQEVFGSRWYATGTDILWTENIDWLFIN